MIPNYNAREMLARCLRSIYRNPPRRTMELIVVDDASRDGSAEMVRDRFPAARLLTTERNRGQSYANNRAARQSSGRYLLFLNNDTEFLPGAIDALASFLDTRPGAAAAGSVQLNPDGTLQGAAKPLPSVRTAFFGRRSPITRLFPRNPLSRQELLDWRAERGEPFRVGFVHGASIMIRREDFFAIGGFDPYLFNFSDADLCKRLHDRGREVYCVPESVVIHDEHRGGSSHSLRQRFWRVWRFHADVWRYYRKHHSRGRPGPLDAPVALFLAIRFLGSASLQVVAEAQQAARWAARRRVRRGSGMAARPQADPAER